MQAEHSRPIVNNLTLPSAADAARRMFARMVVVAALLSLTPPVVADTKALSLAHQSRSSAAQGNLEHALAQAQNAVERLRDEAEYSEVVAYLFDDQANYLLKLQRFSEASQAAASAVEFITRAKGAKSPERGILLGNLGAVQVNAGKVVAAQNALVEADSLVPAELAERKAVIAFNLSRVRRMLSDLDGALASVNSGLQFTKGDANSLLLIIEKIEILLLRNDIDAARQLIEVTPEIPRHKQKYLQARIAFEESRLRDAQDLISMLLREPAVATDMRVNLLAFQGNIHILLRELGEAQHKYREALRVSETSDISKKHPFLPAIMHALAISYYALGDYDEASVLFAKAIEMRTIIFGAESRAVALSKLEYTATLVELGLFEKAQAYANQAVAILQGYEDKRNLGLAYSARGKVYMEMGDVSRAERDFARAVANIAEGDSHYSPDLPPGLLALSDLLMQRNDYSAALKYLDDGIAVQQKLGADTVGGLAMALAQKAVLHSRMNNIASARKLAEKAIDITDKRMTDQKDERLLREIKEHREIYERVLDVSYRYKADSDVRDLMFRAVQYPSLSAVSATIAQLAERFDSGNKALADLLEQRQRSQRELKEKKKRLENYGTGITEGAGTLQALTPQIVDLQAQLAAIEQQIAVRFPRFSATALPSPASLPALQSVLAQDQAVFTMLASEKNLHIFLITSDAMQMKTLPVGEQEIQSLIRKIRDTLRWDSQTSEPAKAFDFASAHHLYKLLLQPFEEELKKSKHLIYVPDAVVANIPFGLLTTTPHSGSATGAPFLQRDLALSMLPSINSLLALRMAGRPDGKQDKFLAVGNPVLGEEAAQLTPMPTTRGIDAALHYDLHARLAPLRNTAREAKAIARYFKGESDLLLSRVASEKTLSSLSEDLKEYSVILFATHGLLKNDRLGISEPALVMTRDKDNDGLLYASEIAQLSLDADWVILSACDTAAGDGSANADGLSGLAQAFFFAGARSLLLSHWQVNTKAAELITTKTFSYYRGGKEGGKAVAMQQALTAMIGGEYGKNYAHPAYWAPFVIVGI